MAEKKTKKKAVPKAQKAEKVASTASAAEKPSLPANALILSYRGGNRTRRTNQMLIEVEGAGSKTKASAYIGRRVVWKTPSGKLLYGTITHPHGNKGVLRARFSRGLPGEALGKRAKIC